MQRAEDAGWTVRADVPTEAALSPEDLDGVAAVLIDARDATAVSSRADEGTDFVEPLTAREHEVLEQMAAEKAGELKLVKVNADDAPSVSRRFEAQAIPTLVVLRNGQVIARQVGAAPAAVLRPWLDEALAKQEAS